MKRVAVLILAVLILAVLALVATSAHAAFPGRNGAIVYGIVGFDGGRYEIGLWTTSPIDGRRAPLLGCEGQDDGAPIACGGIGHAHPAVSPDGRTVVFDAGTNLATVDFDGTDLRLLPAHSADDSQPAFSPDGSQIVFTAGRRSLRLHSRQLWVGDRSGTGAHRLPVTGHSPVWSTRNSIAFVRGHQIYRIRPSGRGLRRIAADGSSPTWSPDGRRIAYLRAGTPWSDRAFVVARGDGTDPRPVFHDVAVSDAAWSPDGRRLLLIGAFSGLLVIDLHGKELHRFYGGEELHADQDIWTYGIDWQPLP